MIQIQQWLNGKRDFSEGITLYEQHIKNETWLRVFRTMGDTPVSRTQLVQQLNQLLVAQSVQNAAKPPVTERKLSESVDAPQQIKDAVSKRKLLYKQVNRLHEQLVQSVEKPDSMTVDERKELAQQILAMWDEIDELWIFTDHYDTTREVMAKQEPLKLELVQTPNELMARRLTLRTYLTPSYLKRIPEARREAFEKATKAELKAVEKLLEE